MTRSLLNIPSNLNRRTVITGLGLLSLGMLTSPAHSKKTAVKKILFVCQYGTAKSAIAREFFRQRAQQRNIAVFAFSRGIMIEDHITPKLRKNFAKDGINPSIEAPQLLKPDDWRSADILVAFNPLPSDVRHPDIRDWTDLPSIVDNYKRTRSIMKKRIDGLLSEIQME